jgi:hypothetical protein
MAYIEPVKPKSRTSTKICFESEVFSLSDAKTYLGRLLHKASSGKTVYIVRGQQRFLLQPAPIDPIPLRPAGYFNSAFSNSDIKRENRLAKNSVIRAPKDLE